MSIIRFIGDVHGKYEPYKRLIKNGPPSIQIGDMGVGFRRTQGPKMGEVYRNPPHYMMQPDHRFIRGNHDNPQECKKQSQYIPDGHVENGMMFVGGAVSIDRAYRIEGFSWWPDEELTTEELNQLVDKYREVKPRIMVTHDCPEGLAQAMLNATGSWQKLDPKFSSRTRQALEAMWQSHSPELWVFGHWHVSFDHVLRGTRMKCLAELEHFDVDV